MTPPMRASVFFASSDVSSLNSRQSGRIEEKILTCFTCPHIITCGMPSSCRISMSLPSAPAISNGSAGANCLDFGRGFLFDRDHNHSRSRALAPLPARAPGSVRFPRSSRMRIAI